MTRHRTGSWLRIIAAIAALALLAGACGDDGDDAAPTTTETTAAPDDEGTETTETTEAEPAGDPEPAPGFDGTTINVGILVPRSGLPAIIGSPLASGQEVYWAYVNDELGGVAGRYPVQPMVEDTLYETNVTVQQYNRIKNDVVLFSQVMGPPTTRRSCRCSGTTTSWCRPHPRTRSGCVNSSCSRSSAPTRST
jgi:ABC-type branched-subunit amino acid transport system substrate-binding protein